MKKLLLILIVTIISNNATAEWTSVGGNDDVNHYADLETVRLSGSRVKMWTLADFKIEQIAAGYTFLSSRSQMEFDCIEEQSRTIAFTWLGQNMGLGRVVHTTTNPNIHWMPVGPQTVAQALWIIACRTALDRKEQLSEK